MSADPHGEIERIAREQREREAREAPVPPGPETLAAARAANERSTVETALTGGKSDNTVAVILFLAFLMAPAALVGAVVKDPGFLPLFAASAVGLVLGLVVLVKMQRQVAGRRIRALRRVPGLDVDGYLGHLGGKRRHATVVVRLRFTRDWEESQRASVTDALRGWVPDLAPAEWEPRALVLRSPEIHCVEWAMSKTGTRRYFTNAKLHGVVAGILEKVRPPLHAANPVERIEVEILGKLLPLDEAA